MTNRSRALPGRFSTRSCVNEGAAAIQGCLSKQLRRLAKPSESKLFEPHCGSCRGYGISCSSAHAFQASQLFRNCALASSKVATRQSAPSEGQRSATRTSAGGRDHLGSHRSGQLPSRRCRWCSPVGPCRSRHQGRSGAWSSGIQVRLA